MFSCSKEKRAYNKLDGIWEITNARIEDGEGFAFYTSAVSGTMEIQSDAKVCSTLIAFSYENLSELPFTIYDTLEYINATFTLNNSGEQLEVFHDGVSDKFRIIELTKDDLIIEFYDYPNYKLKRFTFRKK
jgi:hypothetical protein